MQAILTATMQSLAVVSLRYPVRPNPEAWVIPEGPVPESTAHHAAWYRIYQLLEAWAEREGRLAHIADDRKGTRRWLTHTEQLAALRGEAERATAEAARASPKPSAPAPKRNAPAPKRSRSGGHAKSSSVASAIWKAVRASVVSRCFTGQNARLYIAGERV